MNQLCKDAYDMGLHWIAAFIVIAALTVTTCMKQQHMLIAKASSHTMVLAMKQSGQEIR